MNNYCIQKNYIHRPDNKHWDASNSKDKWQNHVYKKCKQIADEYNLNTILDIGCGSAFKLMKYFSNYDTYGCEIEPALSFIKNKYPNRKWYESDFLTIPKKEIDLIISSDVIEHLPNPDLLIKYIKNFNIKFLVISTPVRNPMYENGPPKNETHCREWSVKEFNEYISYNFPIIEHIEYTTNIQHTQLVICKRNK